MSAAQWLRERAESYATDAGMLRQNGHLDDALVYEAIRDELRKIAEEDPVSGMRAEYALRIEEGADKGDTLPISWERAHQLRAPYTINGKAASLIVRTVTTGPWRAADPCCPAVG